jgi:hypothetical protein
MMYTKLVIVVYSDKIFVGNEKLTTYDFKLFYIVSFLFKQLAYDHFKLKER